MKKILLILVVLGALLSVFFSLIRPGKTDETNLSRLKEKFSKKKIASVKHSKFEVLQKNFTSPQQVTEACIGCHTERHTEVMKSNHWNWEREEYIEGRGIVYLGKKNAINNFCIGVEGNEQSCAKCHIGFGLKSDTLNLNEAKNIDCLICHDNTETYAKAPEKGGAPDPKLDLNKIAQSVGTPKRTNCGVCHFFGGGGNNVKHGDLEKAMFEPTKNVDVHMGTDASNLQCTDCHKTEKHNISGKMYSLSSMNRNRATCEECHTGNPHTDDVLNNHTLKVSCQACHIPVYAKVNATKTAWDWSTAGKLKDGEPFEIDDSSGNHTYLSIKGSFTWGKNLKPDYIWFNGTAEHYLLGDKIEDTTKTVILNTLNGSYEDKDSKITPVKIHTAKQPYDPVTKLIIQPKLFAEKKGEGAFWKDFDWKKASEEGMKDVNLPFSGNITFVNTKMYWPVNHMVSSKENTVKCIECHTRNDSRLAGLNDFYMPARDYNKYIEFAGFSAIILSFAGVVVHGTIRVISSRKNRSKK